ncbi:MAG: hypothetical protein RL220_1609, partial [Bacteroidota bacterium]
HSGICRPGQVTDYPARQFVMVYSVCRRNDILMSGNNHIFRYLALSLSAFLLLLAHNSLAQDKKYVRLIHADVQEFDKSVGDMQRLIGNVQFEYQGTLLYCDSAWLYNDTRDFDAYGRVRMIKGSDYVLTGDFLHLDQKSKVAIMQRNVVLRDREMTLNTQFLSYNMDSGIAAYSGGGNIESAKNRNRLSSTKGYYHSATHDFYFRNKVVLKNPDYTVVCDTLRYNNLSEISWFLGPTTITGEDTEIYCENGTYDSKKDLSRFGRNARVRSGTTILRGDSIVYDGNKNQGDAFRNVSIRDTTENLEVTGERGSYHGKSGRSWVTGMALLAQYLDTDTLYLGADTLVSVSDSLEQKTFYAYRRVALFKSDMQGLCDSLVYSSADSTMRLFRNPVLWSDQNQITGDSITIYSSEGVLQRMIVRQNALVLSEAAVGKYNRISGRELTGYFSDNKLFRVWIEGNGELSYYPTGAEDEKAKLMGRNDGECSNIEIFLNDNRIRRIKLHQSPSTDFLPMSQLPADLPETPEWRIEGRPSSVKDVVH